MEIQQDIDCKCHANFCINSPIHRSNNKNFSSLIYYLIVTLFFEFTARTIALVSVGFLHELAQMSINEMFFFFLTIILLVFSVHTQSMNFTLTKHVQNNYDEMNPKSSKYYWLF